MLYLLFFLTNTTGYSLDDKAIICSLICYQFEMTRDNKKSILTIVLL